MPKWTEIGHVFCNCLTELSLGGLRKSLRRKPSGEMLIMSDKKNLVMLRF